MSTVELAARTLQIPPERWRAVLAAYRAALPPAAPGETPDGEIQRCLAAFGPLYRGQSPHEEPLPAPVGAPRACPACGGGELSPRVARRPGLVYGRCAWCGHGAQLDRRAPRGDAAIRARHADPDYHRRRDAGGAGYDRYGDEAAYREAKGARLVERLRALPPPAIERLLEVGSGYGFTRAAAERAGLRTAGADVNAAACAEAEARYGLRTFTGTLAEALAAPASGVAAGGFDAVLYQFVLEHVADPSAELADARRALRPGGWLALLVPSMDAAEADVFGASYRSFRADHLHLFSPASLAAMLERAGFALALAETRCNLHLFADVLSPAALERLYASGRGPDLFAIARSTP